MAPRILQIARGTSEPMRVYCRKPGPAFNREGDRKQAAHGQALGPRPSGPVSSPPNPLPCRTPRRAAHAGAVFLAPQQRTSTSPSGATAADSPSNRSPRSSQHRRIRMGSPSGSARRFPAIRLLDRERGRPSRPQCGASEPLSRVGWNMSARPAVETPKTGVPIPGWFAAPVSAARAPWLPLTWLAGPS